ncbi:MAG TPA: ABC transporter permease [Rhizomicrobium sp.]|nr:ABC transporter permease [Rhizomicrobium sp.]
MKYFPLVWAALWRKPARTILTFLSAVAAFTLFGTMIGFNASVARIVDSAQADRVYVYSRFASSLPLAYREQIERLPGIAKIGYRSGIPGGYYQDRKNRVYVYTIDDGWCRVRPEFQMTEARCRQLQASPTGIFVSHLIAERYHLKPGDVFPVTTMTVTREDGGKVWPFTVIGILDDIPRQPAGFILGNYAYQDEARPMAERGTLGMYALSVQDPARAAATARAIETMFANSADPVHSDTETFEAEGSFHSGVNIPFVTTVVGAAGLAMILFLTAICIAQSVRERTPEFAMLKTLGFSGGAMMALVFAEALIPCLLGAAIGLGLAGELAREIPRLLPPDAFLPAPYMPVSLLGLAFACALLVALLSTALPAWRLKRLDIASALAGR